MVTNRAFRQAARGMRGVWVGVIAGLLAFVPAHGAVAEASSLLVDAAWLHAHRTDPDLRIVDVSTDRRDYDSAHIPGAVFFPLGEVRIATPAGTIRLPTAEEATRAFSALGIGPNTLVVVYDEGAGLRAAQLFFTLDVYGHARIALLDGGVQAWRRAGFPLTSVAARAAPTIDRFTPNPRRTASADWLLARLNDPSLVLVDTRSPAEFAGADLRAKRGGHIVGAVNVEWIHNLRPDGTFKTPDALRSLYAAHGITPDKTIVTYCQTHARASHTYFVLRLLGFPDLRGYDGSWAEWGNREGVPIAR